MFHLSSWPHFEFSTEVAEEPNLQSICQSLEAVLIIYWFLLTSDIQCH